MGQRDGVYGMIMEIFHGVDVDLKIRDALYIDYRQILTYRDNVDIFKYLEIRWRQSIMTIMK